MKLFNRYTGELAIKSWAKFKLYQRRERLVKKWSLNTIFKKQSIIGTWEVEFMNLVPEDDTWHHVIATVTAYVKKDKVRDDSVAERYIDGVKIANVAMLKGKNIKVGRPRKVRKSVPPKPMTQPSNNNKGSE